MEGKSDVQGWPTRVQELSCAYIRQLANNIIHPFAQYLLSTCHGLGHMAIVPSYIVILLYSYSLSHTWSSWWNYPGFIAMGFRELKVTQVRNSFVRGDGIQAETLTLKFVNGSSDIVCRMGGKGQYYQDPVTASKDQSEKISILKFYLIIWCNLV